MHVQRIITKEFRIVSYECGLSNKRKPKIKVGLNLDVKGENIVFLCEKCGKHWKTGTNMTEAFRDMSERGMLE